MTLLDIYNTTVKPLTTAERLRLATMILNDIPPEAVVDFSNKWTDEDLRDFTAASWDNAPPYDEDANAEGR